MFCVIQELQLKKAPPKQTSKEIEVQVNEYSFDGVPQVSYSFGYSKDKFERPIKKTYKISIHENRRESGKIKKKQWHICTMNYYDMIEFGPYDCINLNKLNEKLEQMGIEESELWGMVYEKLNPIIEQVEDEYKLTAEYKADKEQQEILKNYRKAKKDFEDMYGENSYNRCFDVFGVLRNEEYLNQLKSNYEAKKDYERSYHSNNQSNYNWNDYFSGYLGSGKSNYSLEEAKLAQEIITAGYKQLSKRLHPDSGGKTEDFQMLGNLKDKLLKSVK